MAVPEEYYRCLRNCIVLQSPPHAGGFRRRILACRLACRKFCQKKVLLADGQQNSLHLLSTRDVSCAGVIRSGGALMPTS